MNTNEYKRNVAKALPVKATKAALRHVARNNTRSNLLYALMNLKTATGKFLADVQPYVLGLPMDQKTKDQAFQSIGEVGHYLVATAKLTGSKLPSSTKKTRLKNMTRGKAMLMLDAYATELMDVERNLFDESMEIPLPSMVDVPKEQQVAMLNDAKKAHNEMVAKRDEQLHERMQEIMQKMVPLFWSLVYDTFSVSPSEVFKASASKLTDNVVEVVH